MTTAQIVLSVIGTSIAALLAYLAVKRMNDSSGAATIVDAAKGLIAPYVDELHRAEDRLAEVAGREEQAVAQVSVLETKNDDLSRRLAALEAKCRGIEELLDDRRNLATRLEYVDGRVRKLEGHIIANGLPLPD